MTNNERINYSKISSSKAINASNNGNKKEINLNTIAPNITPYEKKIETEHVMEAVVTAEKLNIRKTPEVEDNVITIYSKGHKVNVIEKDSEWCKIKDTFGEAYVMTKFIEFL